MVYSLSKNADRKTLINCKFDFEIHIAFLNGSYREHKTLLFGHRHSMHLRVYKVKRSLTLQN